MKHTYHIQGMSCNGCRNHVEEILLNIEGISDAIVNLEKAEATVILETHISLEKLQEAFKKDGGNYSIHPLGEHAHTIPKKEKSKEKGTGIFYCPMHCEGDKTYPKPGDCPVCGMDLVEEKSSVSKQVQFTCPMHPEIIKDEPGACPICGMDLVPLEAEVSEEEKNYKKLKKKFWIATAFTLPIFLIAMSEMLTENPLYAVVNQKTWNWIQFVLSIPVVFYATWMFFKRAWVSIKTTHLNMFTLIGIGAGIAWVFSVFAMIFPSIFPNDFRTSEGNVFVYFEATTVILTLVLLGQLLEARAHSQTSGAIKELLKLVPSTATLVVNGEDTIIAM